ncbi:hypothetical protein DFH06DRAFT_1308021 [Mycena polygramma]|nr:hypothetical protein DFH06DRAFT_1308021 [Mycena polygramma]
MTRRGSRVICSTDCVNQQRKSVQAVFPPLPEGGEAAEEQVYVRAFLVLEYTGSSLSQDNATPVLHGRNRRISPSAVHFTVNCWVLLFPSFHENSDGASPLAGGNPFQAVSDYGSYFGFFWWLHSTAELLVYYPFHRRLVPKPLHPDANTKHGVSSHPEAIPLSPTLQVKGLISLRGRFGGIGRKHRALGSRRKIYGIDSLFIDPEMCRGRARFVPCWLELTRGRVD